MSVWDLLPAEPEARNWAWCLVRTNRDQPIYRLYAMRFIRALVRLVRQNGQEPTWSRVGAEARRLLELANQEAGRA